jgi:enoyl-CoA hydratase/carnithine racemase
MTSSVGSTPLILTDVQEGIAILRLNRPEKRNAVNEQMSAEALDALDAFEADDSVRCIVLTGTGEQSFCAGQDMAEASGRAARPAEVRGGGAGGLARRLGECAKPVIAAINGFCYGGGLSIALSCDYRFAAETATFRLPGASYGLVVAATLLTSTVGPAMAKELIFTARTFDAAEALRIGLVNRVVPAQELGQTAIESAKLVAGNSPLAIAYAKRVVNAAAISAAGLEQEAEANRALRGGEDHLSRFGAATDRIVRQHRHRPAAGG